VDEAQSLGLEKLSNGVVSYLKPFKQELHDVIFIGNPLSKLDCFQRLVVASYLDKVVYQLVDLTELSADAISRVVTTYNNDYLLIVNTTSLEEQLFLFINTTYVISIFDWQQLVASNNFQKLSTHIEHNANHILVYGTFLNDKYYHHHRFHPTNFVSYLPQFLTDIAGDEFSAAGKLCVQQKIKK